MTAPTPGTPPPEPLAVRARDAAKLLTVSPRTLWQWTKDGRVPCVRMGDGKRSVLLYPVAELKAMLVREAARPPAAS